MSVISTERDNQTKEWLKQVFNEQKDFAKSSLASFQQTAFDEMLSEEFPTRRDEDWKYTNVGPIIKIEYRAERTATFSEEDLKPFLIQGLEAIQVVHVNGVFMPELSKMAQLPAGLTLMSLSNAMEDAKLADQINTMLKQSGGTAKNVFLRMNRAFAQTGYYVAADKKARIETPIHFLYINTDNEKPHFAHPQMFVHSDQSSEMTIIESHHTVGNEAIYLTNCANHIVVEDNANLHHYRLQYDSEQAYQINNTIVTQGRDSVYSNYGVDLGGKVVRNNLSTELLNSGTMTNYYGTYLGTKKQHIDNQTFIDHAVPHCDSNELYKGILTDKARGIFNGKVLVRQDAQKTNAYQQNSSLVLSDTAVMDAKPQLEIFADDVKCSHGATIGQLDDNSIFYLKSRGLNEEAAKNLLQKAFVGDVVTNFKNAAIKEDVLLRIDCKLEEK